jgi:hypothetical protein
MFMVKLAVIASIGIVGYALRDHIAALSGGMRNLTLQSRDWTQRADAVGEAAPAVRAIRAESEGPPLRQQSTRTTIQHVVLYEEDPAVPTGKRYEGSATWQAESVPGGTESGSDSAIRVDVTIPERKLGMTLSLRRNPGQASPASHTVQLNFTLPPDFPFGDIGSMPGVLMKGAELDPGTPLSGFVAKVGSSGFVLGLAAGDAKSNIQLLKDRPWIGVPVAYGNGRRAVIAIEKGDAGERMFRQAFAAWKQ